MLRSLLFGTISLLAISPLPRAQTPLPPQIEMSQQFVATPEPIDLQGQRNAPQAADFGAAGTDDDSFGTQTFLKREEKPQPFAAFAEIGAFVTNNVALTKRDPQEDAFLVVTTGAAFARRLSRNLGFNLGVRAAAYRYDKFPALNFQSLDLSAGLGWTPPQLRGAEVYLRYTFTDLTSEDGWQEFYKNQAILIGAQKVVPLTRAQAVYVGASAQWSFAEPQPAGRDEYVAYAGYRAQLTRRLDADLYYRYGRYIYRAGEGRKDHNQTLSLTLHYVPAPWLSFSAAGFLGVNRSNQSTFDYEAGNLGVGAQTAIRF